MVQRLGRVFNPCFCFRPETFFRACWRKIHARPSRCVVRTAWGDQLEVEPGKFIGSNIYMRGVHELVVCEALHRLADAGETVVDGGANIGVMTSILSRKVTRTGEVLAFEPHPGLFAALNRNVSCWPGRRVRLFNQALSDSRGTLMMRLGPGFCTNEGTARIESGSQGDFAVEAVPFDKVGVGSYCGVFKLDVEGHEFAGLSGAKDTLKNHRIRDVVFESGREFPNPTHKLLLESGYEIFDLINSFRGPDLSKPYRRSAAPGVLGDYLATLNSRRAQERLRQRGWQILQRP